MVPNPLPAGQVAPDAEIRAHFPALERRHRGESVAYFDGPGGTQVPRQVVEAVADYLYRHNANTHWAYPTSAETDAAIAAARRAAADFLNAAPEEVAFGANMTTLTFHLSRALGTRLRPGDEVVVTELDHHANVDPWRLLARERGLTVRTVRMDPQAGCLDADDLDRALTGRTRVLAIGAASNALGTITDVAAAARRAHEFGALVVVDAVHYAPHRLVDVRALGCDFLVCSAYKFYGPHVGLLCGRRELFEAIEVPKLRPAPDAVPERWETGTKNHEGLVGAAAAIDFLASLAPEGLGTRRERLDAVFRALHARHRELTAALWEGLSARPRVRLFGPPPDGPRTPTVAFAVRDLPPVEVCRRLADRGLFASHGDFYATTVIERLGLAGSGGLVRVGCSCYTTRDEIDRLLAACRALGG